MPPIHLWTLQIPDTIALSRQKELYSLLSPAEQKRHDQMGSKKRRKEYLLSHALARNKIAEVLKMAPADLPLVFDENGKPSPICDPRLPAEASAKVGSTIHDPLPHYLSLSHTHSLIACALAPFPVGVDVEPIGRVVHIDDVARRMFHPEEVEELIKLGDCERGSDLLRPSELGVRGRQRQSPRWNDGEKKLRFTQYWTLREAFYKASGMKLAEMREGVVFKHDPPSTIHHPPSTIPWHFSLSRPLPDHIMAVAIQSPEKLDIRQIEVIFDELI